MRKRAYAYVDRWRGASKYLDEDDTDALLGDATVQGFLLKKVERKLEFMRASVATPNQSSFHLEWCELRGRTLYYTRRDSVTGDSLGFTKKLCLGSRPYEARYDRERECIKVRSLTRHQQKASKSFRSPRHASDRGDDQRDRDRDRDGTGPGGGPGPGGGTATTVPRAAILVLAFRGDAPRTVRHAKAVLLRVGDRGEVARRATQGCFHCHLPTLSVFSDQIGIKKQHSPYENLRRDDHLGPNHMSL